MGKSSQKEQKLAGRVSLALAAGMFSVVPVAHGMPTPDAAANLDPRSIGLGGLEPFGKTMNVTATQQNTVAHWKDFSINYDETVHFQDDKNFMNIVTGKATSAIEGTMTGGNNVYLINPNGVIFGETANVNVGNLYVSTRNDFENLKRNFTGLDNEGNQIEDGEGNPIGALSGNAVLNTLGTPLISDIVNLTDGDGHSVQANTVVMEGRNIRFLNVVNTTATGTIPTDPDPDDGITGRVTLRSNYNASYANKDYTDGYIHIGHRDTDVATVSDAVTDAYTKYAYGYVNNEAIRTKDENKGVVDYTLVYNAKSDGDGKLLLTDIATHGFNKNYMLAENIDACNMTSPIGNGTTAFSGKFDGMFKQVSNLSLSGGSESNYLGLFGHASGARIENVGVENVSLNGDYAGGIVGNANNTALLNVWAGSGIVSTKAWALETVGGIVGHFENSILNGAYNSSNVKGAGIVGYAIGGTVTNVYNIGQLEKQYGTETIYGICFVNDNGHTNIKNSYTASNYIYSSSYEELIDDQTSDYSANKVYSISNNETLASITASSFTSASTDGGSGATWRLYQGTDQLPLLTAFFKGTVSTEYSYNADANTTRTSTVGTGGTYNTTADGKTLPNKTYDATSVYLSYEQNAAGKFVLDNGNYRYATTEELADTTITKYQGKSDLQTTYYGMNTDGAGILQNDRKDVYTGAGTTAQSFALFYGNQQGYDLYGNNFTLNKRALTVSVTPGAISKTYDGETTKSVDLETSAAVDAIDGLIPGDTVGVKGTLTYTYYDSETGVTANANAGNKWISIVGSNDVGPTGDGGNNYSVDLDIPTSRMEGEIYKRKIMVSLKTAEGIDKTYDGTSDVTNESGTGLDHALNNYTNIQYEVDTTGLAGDTPEEIAAKRDMLVNQNFDSGGIVIKNSVLAKYIGNNGTTPAIHVADTSDDSYAHVAYTGIELNTPSDNFVLVDEANPNQELTSESFLYGKGKITPRKLSTKELSVSGDDPVSKTYDGTTTTTVGTGSSIGFVSGSIRTTKSNAQSDHTGILNYTYKDENNNDVVVNDNVLTFTPDGTATFFYKDGDGNLHETADATDSGDTGATIAKYGATVGMSSSTPKASVWTDYVWDNGDELSNGAEILAGGADNSGHIDKRTVNVALVKNANIDKVYDGDENVKTNATGGIDYHATPASGATGNLKYADGYVVTPVNSTDASVLVNDNTSISINQATYNDKNVAYETDGVTPKAKIITYTLKVSGDAAKNYIINGDDSVASGDTLTLNASGKITPKALTVTATQTAMDVGKTYDGTSDVEPSDVNTTNLSVTGWASGDNAADLFKIGEVSASYGEGTTDAAFGASANVAYTGSSVTSKDVQYIGLQGALKSKNYTISNTAYGKGIIYKATINKANLVNATSVNNNTLAEKVYDGTTNYDDSGIIASPTKAKQYLTLDYGALETAGIHLTDTDKEKLVYTIADAVYNADQTKDVGTKNMTLTFNFVKSGNANFDLVNDSDQVIDLISLEKTGYQSDVTKRTVTAKLTGQPDLGKVYDGGTNLKKADGTTYAASDMKAWFSLSGIVDGETNDVVLNTVTLEGAYATAGAGTGKTVNYTGVQLSGTDVNPASNYTLVYKNANNQTVDQITGVGTINKRHVIVTSVGDVNKTYDGDAAVKLNIEGSSTALAIAFANAASNNDGLAVPGEISTLGDVQGIYGDLSAATFENANVNRASGGTTPAEKRDVRYTGVENALGGNYVLDVNSSATVNPIVVKNSDGTYYVYGKGTINPANKTVTVTAIGKEYDGTSTITKSNLTFADGTDSTLVEQISIANDSTAIYGGNGNAGTNNLEGTLVLSHSENGTYNYNVTMDAMPTEGTVTARKIYAHLVEPTNVSLTKTYDGTTNVKQEGVHTWVQLVENRLLGNDGVSFAYENDSNVVYEDANADENADGTLNNKNVYFQNVGLTGNEAGNYQLILKQKDDTETPLTGDGTGALTTTGTIAKRVVSVKSFGNPESRAYNGTPYVTADAIAALTPTLEQAIYTGGNLSNNTGVLAGDVNKLGLNTATGEGQLKGVYGSWDASGDFVADTHAGEDKDVLYYNLNLVAGTSGDATQNYKLATSPVKTIFSENDTAKATPLATTVYFQDAVAKGTITPLSLTMANVSDNWVAAPTKTYDGTKFVTDAEGNVLALNSDNNALGQYYQIQWTYTPDGSSTPITGSIPYTVTAASYDTKNAGDGKTVTLSGFGFNSQLFGDIGISADTLMNGDGDHVGFAAGRSINTASIARRVIAVSADDVAHTKTYDGSETMNGTYDISKLQARNDESISNLIGKDQVSVTYVANFGNKTATIDPTADATDQTLWTKDVTYTFTLNNDNYKLADSDATDDYQRTIEDQKGAIVKRTIKVAWKDGEGSDLDKTYDGSASLVGDNGKLLANGSTDKTLADITKLAAVSGTDGVVDGDDVSLNVAVNDDDAATAVYLNKAGTAASANANAKDGTTINTRTVLIQNLNLTGNDSGNYYLETTDLKGKGDINQKTAGTITVDAERNVREYDGTTTASTKKADETTSYVTLNPSGVLEADAANFKFEVESAIYYDKDTQGATPANPTGYSDAKDGLGVVYRLKWNDKNYTLDRVAYGEGDIKPRTLQYKDAGTISVDKTYDGTTNITDSTAVANELFSNVVKGDDVKLVKIDSNSHYTYADTGAAANSKKGAAQAVELGFTIKNSNYRLSSAIDGKGVIDVANTDDEGYSQTGTYTGTGRINRAQVTMTPTEVSYCPSQLATAKYKGQASGFVDSDRRPTMTYGRDGNTSTAAGSYTLLGYVNSIQVPVNGATFVDGFENYYFTTTPNKNLNILAEPVNPDNPVTPDIPDFGNKTVTRVVTELVISDTKFTPDEYSYNRMSKDPDTTHVNRVSSATLQYSEKGVNIEGEDTKSGLASLADVQGRGSVVNLNGALIQTSAPAERPEKVAETAALPISEMDTTEDATSLSLPEKEENDDSSIGLEYADNTGSQQSMLEILTNASSKAENKGTSIVIDTQDEDEEDAEIEKTRRAIFADRSNIGIETLGNAVNLNQMIG